MNIIDLLWPLFGVTQVLGVTIHIASMINDKEYTTFGKTLAWTIFLPATLICMVLDVGYDLFGAMYRGLLKGMWK